MAPLIPLAVSVAGSLGASAGTASAIAHGMATAGTIASTVGSYAGVAGAGLSAVGAIREGQATAGQAEIESLMAEGQAEQERLRGGEEARLRLREGDRFASRQRAAYAVSGSKISTGSPLLAFADTALNTQEDVFALGQTTQAKSGMFRSQARTFRQVGKSAKSSGMFKAGSSILSGISQATRSNP